MTAWRILFMLGPMACMLLVMACLQYPREQARRRANAWEMQHRLWRSSAEHLARQIEQELRQQSPTIRAGQLRNSVALKQTSDGIKQMTRVGLGEPECAHWSRDPVVLSTGEQVAFICRKCGVDVVDEAWVGSCG